MRGFLIRGCVSSHQQKVIWSGSHTQCSQKLRATSPVLLSTSKCSQTHLELSKVLPDSARAFLGAPESTCSYGGAFRMLHLGYSNWGAPKTSAQIYRRLREKLRPLRSSAGALMPYSHSSGSYITTRHLVLSYSSYHIHLCYSHNIRYIIIWHALFKSISIYTYSQSGCRWYSSIIGGAPGHAH